MNLASITKQAAQLPSRAIIYGEPGIGKTELAAAFPDPIFLMTKGETGLLTLMQSGRVKETSHFPTQAESWQDVLDAVDALTEGEHEHRTFVIDTLNGAERHCHEMVCRRDYGNDWSEKGFMGYHRGYATAVNDWRNLLFKLDTLRERKRMGIVCLAHTDVAKVKNPLGSDYEMFRPAMHKETWNATVGWSDMVLFAKKEIYITEDKTTKRGKAVIGDRVLLTEEMGSYAAKNRHGLPPEISMGKSGEEAFANLTAALRDGKRTSTTNTTTTIKGE